MLRPQRGGEEHFGQKKEQSWAHVSAAPGAPEPVAENTFPVPHGAPRWLIPHGNNSSHGAAFPLPSKSPSLPP